MKSSGWCSGTMHSVLIKGGAHSNVMSLLHNFFLLCSGLLILTWCKPFVTVAWETSTASSSMRTEPMDNLRGKHLWWMESGGGAMALSCTVWYIHVVYYVRVLPRIKWRPIGWAWFGRNLWPHQSFWFPHQRNRAMEGMGGRYAERAWGEHCTCMY